eukprot:scaffold63293_cov18-Tisochrysis_lutea.AAC.1
MGKQHGAAFAPWLASDFQKRNVITNVSAIAGIREAPCDVALLPTLPCMPQPPVSRLTRLHGQHNNLLSLNLHPRQGADLTLHDKDVGCIHTMGKFKLLRRDELSLSGLT